MVNFYTVPESARTIMGNHVTSGPSIAISINTGQYYKPDFNVWDRRPYYDLELGNALVITIKSYTDPYDRFTRFNFIEILHPDLVQETLVMTEKSKELIEKDSRPGYELTRTLIDLVTLSQGSPSKTMYKFMEENKPDNILDVAKKVMRHHYVLEGHGKSHAEDYRMMYQDPNVYRNRVGKDIYYTPFPNGLGLMYKVGEWPKFVLVRNNPPHLPMTLIPLSERHYLDNTRPCHDYMFNSIEYNDDIMILRPFGCEPIIKSGKKSLRKRFKCKFKTCEIELHKLFNLVNYEPLDGICSDQVIEKIKNYEIRW